MKMTASFQRYVLLLKSIVCTKKKKKPIYLKDYMTISQSNGPQLSLSEKLIEISKIYPPEPVSKVVIKLRMGWGLGIRPSIHPPPTPPHTHQSIQDLRHWKLVSGMKLFESANRSKWVSSFRGLSQLFSLGSWAPNPAKISLFRCFLELLLGSLKGQSVVTQENQSQYFTSEMCLRKRGCHFTLTSIPSFLGSGWRVSVSESRIYLQKMKNYH